MTSFFIAFMHASRTLERPSCTSECAHDIPVDGEESGGLIAPVVGERCPERLKLLAVDGGSLACTSWHGFGLAFPVLRKRVFPRF